MKFTRNHSNPTSWAASVHSGLAPSRSGPCGTVGLGRIARANPGGIIHISNRPTLMSSGLCGMRWKNARKIWWPDESSIVLDMKPVRGMDTSAGQEGWTRPFVRCRRSSCGRCNYNRPGRRPKTCGLHARPGFRTALALTHAGEPSVIQVRAQRVLPEHIGTVVLRG